MKRQQSRLEPDVEFEEDPRYKIANREAVIGVAYWLAFTVLVSAVAWLLGGERKADDLGFVLGFPAWFFWSCLVGAGVLSMVPAWLVRRYYTDVPLSADGSADSADPADEGGSR